MILELLRQLWESAIALSAAYLVYLASSLAGASEWEQVGAAFAAAMLATHYFWPLKRR